MTADEYTHYLNEQIEQLYDVLQPTQEAVRAVFSASAVLTTRAIFELLNQNIPRSMDVYNTHAEDEDGLEEAPQAAARVLDDVRVFHSALNYAVPIQTLVGRLLESETAFFERFSTILEEGQQRKQKGDPNAVSSTPAVVCFPLDGFQLAQNTAIRLLSYFAGILTIEQLFPELMFTSEHKKFIESKLSALHHKWIKQARDKESGFEAYRAAMECEFKNASEFRA